MGQGQVNSFSRRYGTGLLWIVSLAVFLLSFLGSDGFFLVDEFVYFLGADALAGQFSLIIENGVDQFQSRDLVFFNLVSGPRGLVSQYPVGSSVLAAPFVLALDARGLILVNALSAVGTIFLTRSVARRLFNDETVALAAALILVFCTFFVEFAFAIWPHALSTVLIMAAIWLLFIAMDAPANRDAVISMAAGLIVGLAFLVRADALLILPAFGAVIMLYASRPVSMLAGGAVGMIPAFAVAAWANWYKFGALNPLSYGAAPGGISFSQHTALIYLSIVALAFFVGARNVNWRPAWRGPMILGGLVVVAATWLVMPEAQAFFRKYGFGAYNLLADLTVTPDSRNGIISRGDGTVQFWGLPKKALGQSLPWLPILLWVFLRPWGAERRRSLVFCLVALGFWTMPFFLLAWHGGLGSNMRYLFSLLPIISILGALALTDLARLAGRSVLPLALGYALGVALVIVWGRVGPAGSFGAHQILSTNLFLLLLVVTLATSIRSVTTAVSARVAIGAVAVGLGVSTVLGAIQDVANAQSRRAENRRVNTELAVVPEPSLFVGPPEFFAFQIERKKGLISFPAEGEPVDIGLIEQALDRGYGVYVFAPVFRQIALISDRFETVGDPLPSSGRFEVFQIRYRSD